MNKDPAEASGGRRQRAVALGALGLIATAVAGFAYLRPEVQASDVNAQLVSTHPMSFAFVTPSIGWASLVVDGSGWDAGQFRLFRTTDGARHWQQQLVLGGRTSYDADTVVPAILAPISVQIVGETRGVMTIRREVAPSLPAGQNPFDERSYWREVEELYRTRDGGAHWDPVGLPPSLEIEDVGFSDPSYGWLVAPNSAGGQSLSLFATRDGGNNWEPLADLPGDAAGVRFRRPTEGWLGSDGPGPPHVYTSSDSGKSWQRHDLPAPVGISWISDRHFSSFSTRIQLLPRVGAIATVEATPCIWSTSCNNNGNVETPPQTFLMRSGDAGATWKQVPSPPGIVAYQDSIHWWATNTNALYKSTNAGQSWAQAATIPGDWQFTAPSVLDGMHSWAAVFGPAGYGLAVTNDGGLHWTLANVPNPQISP